MQTMLTTTDNPFNPFTQFSEWYAFDLAKGYNSCSYLARIVRVSDSLSASQYEVAVENAIDEIVRLNLTGNYKKVTKKT